MQDVEWLEFERNSWRLVHALYQNRLLADSEAMEEEEAEPVSVHPPSEKEIALRFYKTNSKIDEVKISFILYFHVDCFILLAQ